MHEDIPGICRLAEETLATFRDAVGVYSDPNDSFQPRLKIIGGCIIRPIWKDYWNELIARSYYQAKALGYLASLGRWSYFVSTSEHDPLTVL